MGRQAAGRGVGVRLSACSLMLAIVGLIVLFVAPVASAQEGTAPAQDKALRFNLFNVPIDPPERASRDLLGNAPPPARRSPEWTILPDGSARYGTENFGVVVSPQCLPPARPGRPVR